MTAWKMDWRELHWKERNQLVFYCRRDQLGTRHNEFGSGHTELKTFMDPKAQMSIGS